MFIVKRALLAVAMLLATLMTASAQTSEVENDILLFAPYSSSTYNLSQVAVYLGDLLAQTEGFETADVAFWRSRGFPCGTATPPKNRTEKTL